MRIATPPSAGHPISTYASEVPITISTGLPGGVAMVAYHTSKAVHDAERGTQL